MALPATDDLPFPTSLPDFQRLFPDEAACIDYLAKIRWPHGFACHGCGVAEAPQRVVTRPRVFRCPGCEQDFSVTAGTVMEKTHTPIATWFWGAYLLSSLTPGMSAVQFQRQLGLKRYETAFQILHKLRSAMVRPHRDRIGTQFPVEVDETWVGGKTRGEGRGVHHKTLVVGAVEQRTRQPKADDPFGPVDEHSKALPRRGNKYAGRLRLLVVPDRTATSLVGFIQDNVAPGAHITTDDWASYDHLSDLGYTHRSVAQRGDPKLTEEWLPLIHIVFGNLKTWLNGVHHGVSPHHLQAYLNEYTFRFNRRFYPFNAFRSLLGLAGDADSPTYEQLYSGAWRHPNPVGYVA